MSQVLFHCWEIDGQDMLEVEESLFGSTIIQDLLRRTGDMWV